MTVCTVWHAMGVGGIIRTRIAPVPLPFYAAVCRIVRVFQAYSLPRRPPAGSPRRSDEVLHGRYGTIAHDGGAWRRNPGRFPDAERRRARRHRRGDLDLAVHRESEPGARHTGCLR